MTVLTGTVPSLDTWIVKHRHSRVDEFFYREDAVAFIEREQGKKHPMWRDAMVLTLHRGHTHGKHVYQCWDCKRFFDTLAALSLSSLDFSNGICHLCSIWATEARAFSSWG